MSTPARWKNEILVKLTGIADDVGATGAIALEKALKRNLSKKSGVPSSPGEYPAKQSGELVNSIKRTRRRVGKRVEHEVSVTAKHADIIEKVRPFFERTIKEEKEDILSKMARVARQRGLKA